MHLLLLQCSSIFEKFGGIESYLDDFAVLASTLEKMQVQVLAPMRPGKWHITPRPYQTIGVPFFRNGTLISKIQNRFSLRLLRKCLAEGRKQRPDFLVATHVSLGPLTSVASKILGVPYIVVVYGIEAWGNLLPQDEWALRRASGIISISHHTKRILVERGYASSKIQIVPPTISEEFEALSLTRKNREAGPFKILSVGRLAAAERYKGQDHVIEALALLKKKEPQLNLHYIIQGSGDDQPRLQDLVRQHGLTKEVEFRRPVSERRDLISTYQEADLFVLPSRFGKWDGRWKGEGFGIVYAEAATAGTPSIAYNCGGVTDIIENNKSGVLVSPDNIGQLADSIAQLAKEPATLESLRKGAYDRIHGAFSRNQVKAALKEALQNF